MQESFTKGIILKVATVYAQSLEEFISRVRDFRKKWRSTELWFRGEPPSEYPLTPSLYRPPLSRSEGIGRKNEDEARIEFRQRGHALLIEREPKCDFDWYILMRHNSVLTRLLDWTEGSLIALYFIVRNADLKSRDHEFKWCSKVRSLILAVLLTGFTLQVVECMGVQTSTATGSDDATPHFNRAVELHKKGDLAGAITEYRTVLRLNPNDAEAHIHLGSALNVAGDPDGAITEYRTVLRLNPNHVEAHHNLGLALHDKGDLAGALTEYRTVLRLNPNEVEAHYNLGLALNATGHLYGALTEYRTVLRLNPNEVEAHYNLGNALKALGRQADAREEFTKALGLLPDTPANQHKIKQVKQRIRELE